MLRLLVTRLLLAIPVLVLVSMGTFGLTYLVPGDPAVALLGDTVTPERVQEMRTQLGLNEPIPLQYLQWAGGVLHGDFGQSVFSGRSVAELIWERIPVTLSLAGAAVVFALIIGVPLGILAGTHRGGLADRAVTLVTSVGISLPSYFLALLLVIFFSLRLGWLPAAGYRGIDAGLGEHLRYLILPGLALGMAMSAELARQLRGAVIDVLARDFVRTATAKGLRWRAVLLKHVLRNASLPPVTVLGLQIAHLLGGAVVIEQVFALPGLGGLAIEAVFNRDLPVVQGVVMVAVVVVIVTNIVVDLSYGWLSPKSRLT